MGSHDVILSNYMHQYYKSSTLHTKCCMVETNKLSRRSARIKGSRINPMSFIAMIKIDGLKILSQEYDEYERDHKMNMTKAGNMNSTSLSNFITRFNIIRELNMAKNLNASM